MKVVTFLVENKAVLIPFVLLVISEVQALNPKWESNGIVDFIKKTLKDYQNK